MRRRGLAINSRRLELPLLRRLERQPRKIPAGPGNDEVRGGNIAACIDCDLNFYSDFSMDGLTRAERNLRQNLLLNSLRRGRGFNNWHSRS